MFYKTANVPILGVYQASNRFHKLASKTADLSSQEDATVKKALNLLSKEKLRSIAKIYNLSDNIDDFIFPVARTVTSGTHEKPKPNNNGDHFLDEEMSRFSQNHRCMVYETFRNDPLHVEHVAFDPKSARGFLPDVSYIRDNLDDMHVIAVIALDTKKDSPLAEGMLFGKISATSMGCSAEQVVCSHCKKTAYSDSELCDCLKFYKMADLGNGPIYEDCLGVEFQELSIVGSPADPTALIQKMLQRSASRNELRASLSANPLDGVLEKTDQIEVAKYFESHMNRLPESMIRLAGKLFR